ncbi:RICIN domain-containing protein [Streptomyces piniterrae]|nr:RICIN domain-containing protein [Streptomyces piniterrae]
MVNMVRRRSHRIALIILVAALAALGTLISPMGAGRAHAEDVCSSMPAGCKSLWSALGSGSNQPSIALDDTGSSTDNGTRIQTWQSNGGASSGGAPTGNQTWSFVSNKDGTFTLRNAHSGKCADAVDGSSPNSDVVNGGLYQWDCIGSSSQNWYIQPGPSRRPGTASTGINGVPTAPPST